MPTYLVGILYHEPEGFALWKKGIVEDYESSTGLFIEAENPAEAISWAEGTADALFRKANPDETSTWKDFKYHTWIEESPEKSAWKHCLSFFQNIKVGEWPDFDNMGTVAYAQWAKANGITYP